LCYRVKQNGFSSRGQSPSRPAERWDLISRTNGVFTNREPAGNRWCAPSITPRLLKTGGSRRPLIALARLQRYTYGRHQGDQEFTTPAAAARSREHGTSNSRRIAMAIASMSIDRAVFRRWRFPLDDGRSGLQRRRGVRVDGGSLRFKPAP